MRLAGSQFLHKLGFYTKYVCFGHFFFNLTYSNPHYFSKSLWMLSGLQAAGCKPSQPQEKMDLFLSHLLSATAQGLLLSNSKEWPIIATLYKCIWRAWVWQALHSRHSRCCLGPAQTQAMQTKCSSRKMGIFWWVRLTVGWCSESQQISRDFT